MTGGNVLVSHDDDDDDDCNNQVYDQCQDYLVPSDCRQRFGVNHARDLKIDQLSNHDNLNYHLHRRSKSSPYCSDHYHVQTES